MRIVTCVVTRMTTVTDFTRDSRKISFNSPPSAGNGMNEIHTDVGGTGH
jgi:hypothetical protein